MPEIKLERQGSVWVFTCGDPNTELAVLRVQWKDHDTIPDPASLGNWFALFGDMFGVADGGFKIVEGDEVLWEYGLPMFEGDQIELPFED